MIAPEHPVGASSLGAVRLSQAPAGARGGPLNLMEDRMELQPVKCKHVDELTVYVGMVRDDGIREVFVSVLVAHKRFQCKRKVADWVPTDDILGRLAMVVYDIEAGTVQPWELAVAVTAALELAEEGPF